MPKPVTLKEVAALAGVSRSAVSRTFTPGASVSAKTRAKVEQAASQLGYSPNALASSLTTGRTKLIGLVADNFRNPYFLEIYDLCTRKLQDRGLRPLLVNLSDQTDADHSVRLLQQYSVDGALVASSTLPPSFAERFVAAGVPVVHAFGRASAQRDVPFVGVDSIACGALAAEVLVARGYRRLGFLGGPETASSTQDRMAGFKARAHDLGAEVSHSFAEAYAFDAGRAEMQRLLRAPLAEAYFCADDVLSIGALSALQEAAYRVPQDVGIIGLNDMDIAGWPNIALTTIHQPTEDIVDAAVAMMADMLEGAPPPKPRILPCHLVERATLRA